MPVYNHTDFNIGDRIVLIDSIEAGDPQAGTIISKNDNNSFRVTWDNPDDKGWVRFKVGNLTHLSNRVVFANGIIKEEDME